MPTPSRTAKWILIPFLALALTGCVTAAGDQANPSGAVESVPVTQLSLAETVEATGSVQAEQSASLTWKTTGTVNQIYVTPGQIVEAGDLLAELVPDSAPASVNAARADLINAQQALDNLLRPEAAVLVSAQQELSNAYSSRQQAQTSLKTTLDRTRSTGDSALFDSLSTAWDDLLEAQNNLPLATASIDIQRAYQAALARERALQDLQAAQSDRSPRQAGAQQTFDAALTEEQALNIELDSDDQDAITALVDAQIAYENAFIDFSESLTGSSANDTAVQLQSAWSTYRMASESVNEAVSRIWTLLTEPDPDDVAAAQARVDAAQATVDQISLTAPFTGEVLEVNAMPGDSVGPQQIALTLASHANRYVEIQVDESEIAAVQPGNPVELTFDALPGMVLTGKITRIDPVGQTLQGLVKFDLRIDLDPAETLPPLGATANAIIQVAAPNVSPAVPVGAIQNDARGEFVYRVRADGGLERVDVVSGALSGELVSVSGNLEPGDYVRLAAPKASGLRMPNPFAR